MPQDSASAPPRDLKITDLSRLKGGSKRAKDNIPINQVSSIQKANTSLHDRQRHIHPYNRFIKGSVGRAGARLCQGLQGLKNRHNFEGRVWENRGNWTPNSLAQGFPAQVPIPMQAPIFSAPSAHQTMNQNPRSVLARNVMRGAQVSCWATQFLHQTQIFETCSCMCGVFFWKPFPNILGVFFVLFLLYQGLVAVVCCPNSPAAPFVRHLLCCHRRLQTSKVRRQGFRLRVSKPPWRLLGYGLWRHFLSKSSETRGCVTGRRKPRFQGSLY